MRGENKTGCILYFFVGKISKLTGLPGRTAQFWALKSSWPVKVGKVQWWQIFRNWVFYIRDKIKKTIFHHWSRWSHLCHQADFAEIPALMIRKSRWNSPNCWTLSKALALIVLTHSNRKCQTTQRSKIDKTKKNFAIRPDVITVSFATRELNLIKTALSISLIRSSIRCFPRSDRSSRRQRFVARLPCLECRKKLLSNKFGSATCDQQSHQIAILGAKRW